MLLLTVALFYLESSSHKDVLFTDFHKHLPSIIAEEYSFNSLEDVKKKIPFFKEINFCIYKNKKRMFLNGNSRLFPETIDNEIQEKIDLAIKKRGAFRKKKFRAIKSLFKKKLPEINKIGTTTEISLVEINSSEKFNLTDESILNEILEPRGFRPRPQFHNEPGFPDRPNLSGVLDSPPDKNMFGNSNIHPSIPPSNDMRRLKNSFREISYKNRQYSFGKSDDVIVLSIDLKPPKIESIISTFGGIIILLTTAVLLTILYLFINRLLIPLNQLIIATEKFSSGDLDYRITNTKFNEFQILADSFNHMGTQINDMMKNNLLILGNISHDLKYYLTRLKMEIELEIDDEKVKASLQSDIDTMNIYIDRSTESFKAGMKQIEIKPENISIYDFIYKKLGNHKNINFTVSEAKSDIIKSINIAADSFYFGKAIENLLSNSQKYGNASWVSLSKDQNIWYLEIINSADYTIPTQELSMLFQPFYRYDKSRAQDVKGSGLGLFLTKKIMDEHGFDINLDSYVKDGIPFFRATIKGRCND